MEKLHIPELLKKNLKTLKKFQPLLAEKLWAYLDQNGLENIQKNETPQGAWFLGKNIAPFFQSNNPIVIKREDLKKTLFFIYGLGVPPFLFSCLRALPKEVLGVVVFEPSIDILLYTLSATSVYFAGPQGARIAFVLSDEPDLIDEALGVSIRPMGLFISSDPGIIIHSGEEEAFQQEFESLSAFFRERFKVSLQFLGNTAEDTLLGVRNMFLNAPWIWRSPSLRVFSKEYEGKPVIWVASGPSLNKNIHLLKGMEEKAIIIAAESATKKLLKNDIIPHIVLSLERPWTVYANLLRPLADEFPEQCRHILLAAQSVLTPQAIGCWPGPVIVFGKNELGLDQWLVKDVMGGDLVYAGCSVAHMALSLAIAFKAPCIAFVGQDLAYEEGFVSHASDTASAQVMETEKERGATELFRVPGALGGEVETHFIWYLFLRIFESIIPHSDIAVYDCTEGGALIQSTTVWPLERFLSEKVEPLPQLLKTPAELFLEHARSFEKENLERIKIRLHQTSALLENYGQLLDTLEEIIEKIGAPAILPEHRRTLAMKASDVLDEYHDRNKALAFIGQSYTFLAGAVIGKVRHLNTVEDVVAWQRVFREIHQAHWSILSLMKEYVRNASTIAAFLSESSYRHVLPPCAFSVSALLKEEGVGLLSDILSICEQEDATLPDEAVNACLQLLLSRTDPAHQGWLPEYQWFCALFLEKFGRNHSAGILMASAAEAFSGREVSKNDIVRFWKDSARILSKDDFTFVPPTMLALDALLNAEEYAPNDQEIPEMRKTILQTRRSFLENLLHSKVYSSEAWKEKEIQANLFLSEGRLSEAMVLVWEMLEETEPEERFKLTTFLNWLLKTLGKCRYAEDVRIQSTIGMILDAMAANFSVYSRFSVAWPSEVVEELHLRGVKVSFQSADKQ